MDLFKSHASSFLASDAGQYIAKIGTMWSLTSAIHQTIFRRAWDGNWWPHLRVQKNKQIQKEPTDSIRKIPMLAQIAVVYGLSALNWFVFQRFWLDVRSARPSWWTVAGKLLLGMVYCDVIYYSYHRLQVGC